MGDVIQKILYKFVGFLTIDIHPFNEWIILKSKNFTDVIKKKCDRDKRMLSAFSICVK